MSRRVFVAGPCVSLALSAASRGAGSDRPAAGASGADAWPGFPNQDLDMVREFVGVCHRDIDRVRAMLAEHPALAKCAYDWGYGDWESGLGAAAHTGRVEIARLLIDRGARLDLFAAAMLGMVDVLKAMVAAQPGIESTPGPHGIMLLAHAEAGDDAATIEYVRTLAGATREPSRSLTEEEMARYVGSYRTAGGVPVAVSVTRFGLALKGGGGIDSRLIPTGTDRFHPAGAPNVRVSFTVVEDVARRVEIVEASWFVSATRE